MRARRRGSLTVPILFAILVGCAAQGMAMASSEDWDWNYNGVFGRQYADNDFKPFHIYNEIGVEGSWGKSDEPLLFATDFFASQDTERAGNKTLLSNSYKLQLGLRKIWTFSRRWNPYGGVGFLLGKASLEQLTPSGGTESGSDIAYGVWIGGGIFYRIGTNLNVGVAARACLMDSYRIMGVDRTGNSTHIGFVIGWGAERGGEK